MNGPHHYSRYLWWLIALLALVSVVFAYEVTFRSLHVTPAVASPGSDFSALPSSFPAVAPAPAPSDYVAAQKGFQYLVSYTVAGFNPANLDVKKGETVRFTNNSPASVRIVAASGSSYPGASGCGTSAFDSCRSLNQGEYWEFTFTAAGTWNYVNPLDTSKNGTITAN